LGDRNFSGKVDSVYLQHCGRIDNEIGDEVNESERIREREKVFSDIEKVLRLYLEQQKGNNGLEEDYKKIREIIGLAVENPGEAARKMRLFLHLNASEQTKRLLSINEGKTEYKLDTYLHKHNLGLEKIF